MRSGGWAAFCSTYMEGSYRKGLCPIFDTICIPICYGTLLESTSASEFESKNAKLVETQHYFVYETEQLSLHFEKDYWEMSVYQNGKLLTKEQAFDTNVDNRWKQLPTGFQVDASGKSISTFEQFVLFSDEMFWGFGEKFTHFNKRGQRIECWQKDAADIPSC